MQDFKDEENKDAKLKNTTGQTLFSRLTDFVCMYEEAHLQHDELPTACYHFPTPNPALQKLFTLLDNPTLLSELEDQLLPPSLPKSHHYCITDSARYVSDLLNSDIVLKTVAFTSPNEPKATITFGHIIDVFFMLKFFLFYTSYPPAHLLPLHAFHIKDKCALYVYMRMLMDLVETRHIPTHDDCSYLCTMHPHLLPYMST